MENRDKSNSITNPALFEEQLLLVTNQEVEWGMFERCFLRCC